MKLIKKLEDWEDNHPVLCNILMASMIILGTLIFWFITP